jgi:ribonuclease Z
MNFSVTILGSGAAIPTIDRNPTAHIVKVRSRLILLDCGEGTQVQLRKSGISIQKISHIFISHLHGDHYYGLIGLINTMHLLGRKTELHVYGIQPLMELIEMQLQLSNTTLMFPFKFHPIIPEISETIVEDAYISVKTIPLNHRVSTCGFLISETMPKRRIKKEFVRSVKVPVPFFEKIRDGEDFVDENGKVYPNREITEPAAAPRSYAYCTDTAYLESIIPIIKGCSLLYHEATFADDKAADAKAKFHSTAREAATIAKIAQVGKLVLGHYSARYKDPGLLLKEAQEVFAETVLGEDGLIIEV